LLLPKSLAVFDLSPTFLHAQSMTKRGAHCGGNDIDAGRPVAWLK
jgi:hypothetical protein